MKVVSLVLLVVFVLIAAPSAFAVRPGIEYKKMPDTEPTVRTCEALSWYGQRCRDCLPVYGPDGEPKSSVCFDTKQDKYCTCGDMSDGWCNPKGQCKYR